MVDRTVTFNAVEDALKAVERSEPDPQAPTQCQSYRPGWRFRFRGERGIAQSATHTDLKFSDEPEE